MIKLDIANVRRTLLWIHAIEVEDWPNQMDTMRIHYLNRL